MEFHTVFNVAESLNKHKVYDRHDKVDRNSYVDSTRLIERFILEGNNLNAVRAKALNDGLYQDVEEIYESDGGITVPVYETDPALLHPIIEETKKTLKSRLAKSSNDDSNDDASSKSDLAKRSSDVTGTDA